jgi:hypothetical protein
MTTDSESCGIDYVYIQIAFKISLSIHDCHSHWKKGKKKNDDDNILVFGFEFVRDFSKKIHVVWSFSVTFSCGEESLGPPESVSNQESPLQLECCRYDSSVDETQLS